MNHLENYYYNFYNSIDLTFSPKLLFVCSKESNCIHIFKQKHGQHHSCWSTYGEKNTHKFFRLATCLFTDETFYVVEYYGLHLFTEQKVWLKTISFLRTFNLHQLHDFTLYMMNDYLCFSGLDQIEFYRKESDKKEKITH